MALCSRWFKSGITDPEKAQIELTLRRNRASLDLLTEIVEKRLEEVREIPEKEYANPGWPYLRADRDGQIRVLKEILKLTKLEGEPT